jgi:hypothetical protein
LGAVVAGDPHPAATSSAMASPMASPMADVGVPQLRLLAESLLVAGPSVGDDMVVLVLLFAYVVSCADVVIVH